MSKIFKTLVAFFIILFSTTTLVLATDINMNLSNQNDTVIDGNAVDSNSTDSNELINDTSSDVTNETTNTVDTFQQDSLSGTVAPSSVSSIAQENMSFSNILNILIITVGVILILLAIAILIRLKG